MLDWFLDAVERGQCLSCKAFDLDRGPDPFTAQCYSCGRWYVGFEFGRSECELIQFASINEKKQQQRHQAQSYASMKYEERISYVPEFDDIVGDFP